MRKGTFSMPPFRKTELSDAQIDDISGLPRARAVHPRNRHLEIESSRYPAELCAESTRASIETRGVPSAFIRRDIALSQPPCHVQSIAGAAEPPAPVAGVVAPNVVVISPTLVTAGQPTRASLKG